MVSTKKCMYFSLVFLIVMAIFISFGTATVMAETEPLMLNGTIRQVDSKMKFVTVDVHNKGCSGSKVFSVDDIERLKNSEGYEITFFVDIERCSDSGVHKMYNIRRVQR